MSEEAAATNESVAQVEQEAPQEDVTTETPEVETQPEPATEPAAEAPATSAGESQAGEEVEPPPTLLEMFGDTPDTPPSPVPPAEQSGQPPQQPWAAPPQSQADNLPPPPTRDDWLADPERANQMQERRTQALVASAIADLSDRTTRTQETLQQEQERRRAEALASVDVERRQMPTVMKRHYREVLSKDPHYMGNRDFREFVDQSLHIMGQRANQAGRMGDPRGFAQLKDKKSILGVLAMARIAHDIPFDATPPSVKIAGAEAVEGKRHSVAKPKLDPEQVEYARAMGISEDELIEAVRAEQEGA